MKSLYIKAGSGILFAWLASANTWAETYGFPSTAPVVPVTAATPVASPAPAATSSPAAPAPTASTAPATTPQVSRAAFTSAIAGREPVDQLTQTNAGQQVYYFTELTGLQGHVITHKWERDGAFQLGLQFPVSSSPWRVNSSKSISPNLPGTWTVTVQNDDGSILRRDTLLVNPVQPVIPAPAQPLTNIPPELQRQPAARPESAPIATPEASQSSNNAPPALPSPERPAESQATPSKPIWETLSR